MKKLLKQIKMCLYPRLMKNKKYIANKKNGGIIPAVSDKRVLLVPIKCGKCIECKKQNARNWTVRLNEELKENKGKFITFTFSDESLVELGKNIKLEGYELENEIVKKGVRRFLERWRKKHKKSLKHWFTTELGSNNSERIHIHGIIFSEYTKEEIGKYWKYGRIDIKDETNGGFVNERTINYIVKYTTKIDTKHKEYKPIILCSPGIGKKYTESYNSKLNKYKKNETNENYTLKDGRKINLPIYYRNKIYTEEEREKLWLEKLDKEERWIMGEKISTKNENEIIKLLKWYQDKNIRLGYGSNKINWERKRYENELRNIKKLERDRKSVV